jgi:antiviral defense system Shedu protein SduA
VTSDSEHNLVFLGLAERAAYVRDSNTNLFKWNVLGLKNIILSPIYPYPLSGWNIGLSFPGASILGEHDLRITDEEGRQAGSIRLSMRSPSQDEPDTVLRSEGATMLVPQEGWTSAFFPLGKPDIVINKPGIYRLLQVTPQGERIIGQLRFVVIDPPPLTPERIAAIRSDPAAAKAVRIEFRCNQCSAKCRACAALDRNPTLEAEGWTWYQDLPEAYSCTCGAMSMPLDSLRRNLHGLLGERKGEGNELNFVPLYERSSLETTRSTFATLLASKPKEELLQKFIEENPILLHQFPSIRLFSKPPILTFFVADFALLTPKKELLLIELEKATTRLIKKDGGVAAELSHAFDQVRGWLHVVDEHRLAVLDALKIERDEVSAVRGVVIAGRDVGYDAHHLRKLKGEDWGRVLLFTYDDLLFALDALIRRMDRL